MQTWRRVAFVSVLAWLLVVGLWANRSWTENVPLVTPPDVEAEARSFVCSAPLSTKAVDAQGNRESGYPLAREPCEVHGERRALAILDMGLGVAVLVLLVYVDRRHSSRKEPAGLD